MSQRDAARAYLLITKLTHCSLVFPLLCLAVATGEEDERTVHSLRAKLYTMTKEGSKDGSWKERGTGTLRVLVPKDHRSSSSSHHHLGRSSRPGGAPSSPPKAARLVMRAEGVLRLILNVRLFPGMGVELAQDKFVRFVALEGGEGSAAGGAPCHFAVRCSNAAAGRALYEAVIGHIPKAVSADEAKDASGGAAAGAPMSKATGFVLKEDSEAAPVAAVGDEAA